MARLLDASARTRGDPAEVASRARLRSTREASGTTAHRRTLAGDQQGGILLEYLLACVPLLLLFGAAYQAAHLYAAQLIAQRAASAAGRAACVVLPDDPAFYGGTATHSYAGPRRQQIELAAALILRASPRMLDRTVVDVQREGEAITTTVTAAYRCFPSFGFLVCGVDGVKTLTASARYSYHGASYTYQ